jgi:hypothetical protein
MDIYTNTGQTFERLRECLKWVISEATEMIDDPDGDWPPCLFVENEETILTRPLGGFPMNTEEQKDYLAEVVIPEIVREERGHRAGLYFPAITQGDERLDRYGSSASHPRSREVVVLLAVDRDHCEAWLSFIKRWRHQGPTVGKWLQAIDFPEGRFVEPLRRAVCPQG